MDILIGNGINLGKDNPDFSYDNVRRRFLRCVDMTSSVFNPFVSSLSVEQLSKAIADVDNIEKIATELYNHIKGKYDDEHESPLLKYNNAWHFIQTLIKLIAVTALFTKGRNIIAPNIDDALVAKIKRCENIYTLNYIEKWDTENRCTYLHSKISFPADGAFDKDNSLFYDVNRYDIGDEFYCYKSIIDELRKTHNLIPLECTDSFRFSPDMFDKTEGLYPSEGLCPSKGLYPKGTYNYNELVCSKEICLYGVSPVGDDKLINKLKEIQERGRVIVYVYEYKKDNSQANVWRKHIKNIEIRDCEDF
jgi:hypothetical protein